MPTKPPHLCLLGDATSPHIQRWAREMMQRGWRVSLITARPAPLPGVEQRVLAPVHRSTDWLWRAGAARQHIQALAPDIVNAHYLTSYGYLAARSGRHPVVMTAWGSDLLVTPQSGWLMKTLTGWIVRRADLITGDSQSLVDAARSYRPQCPVQEIHWGVDMARFAPTAWAHKKPLHWVSLRAWEPNYNIDTIVQAFALVRGQLQAQAPDHGPGPAPADAMQLHLLGGGSLEAALRAQVQALGLQPFVQFHGRVDDAQMAAVMADCTVSISVPTQDATSVAMLESMACGLAVVGSDLAANRHWLDARTLVPARNPEALAHCLGTLAQQPALAAQLGHANAQRITRDGDRQQQMNAMDRLYRQLLAAA